MPSILEATIVDRPHGECPDEASTAPAALLARLRRGGLQVTQVRTRMLTVLARLTVPITLRELQAEIRPTPVAFASLYRCILRFEQIALVRRVIGFDGTLRWELNPGTPQGFKITCRHTGQTTEIDADSGEELRRLIEKIDQRLRDNGYTQLQLSIAFHGVSGEAPFGRAESAESQRVA